MERQMPLTSTEVEHVAELARLRLDEREKILFLEQLSAILDYAAVIQGVDTSSVPPTASVLPLENVMREDQARPSLPAEDVLANAPDQLDSFFRVKAILEIGS
jgi:aspartyl-tRNA(Asn)/glutamyl-tRNA(Gln) amidotransferase subunit C